MRVKTDAKRRAILAAAAEVFRDNGFAGASMSAVGERAGSSKATLYRYFPSKADLFVALMLDEVIAQAESVFETLRPSDDLRRTLVRFGVGLLELSLSEASLSVRRNSIAEGARAGLGQPLYERGPLRLWSKMAAFLEAEMAAGRLRAADPWTVAMHLRGMLEADLVNRALIGADVDAGRKTLKLHAVSAVDALLRAYGPAGPVAGTSANATPPSTGRVAPTT
jgi:AcrR family transcriptional regulator